jgi:hypothetical protein
MRNYIILLLVGFIISMSSCREDFEFEPSTGNLTFPKTPFIVILFSLILVQVLIH